MESVDEDEDSHSNRLQSYCDYEFRQTCHDTVNLTHFLGHLPVLLNQLLNRYSLNYDDLLNFINSKKSLQHIKKLSSKHVKKILNEQKR